MGQDTKRPRRCVDCPPGPRPRPAPHPGPRCTSHHRERNREVRRAAHDRRVVSTYRGVGPGTYEEIWQHQGRRDPICLRTGRTTKKRFPLEHHHGQDWPRGITCQRCNAFIGWIRDDPEAARRLLQYLLHPPAWDVIGPPPELREEKPF